MNLNDKIQSTCIALDGWTTPPRLHMMAELILKEKPNIVVELGVFGGRSFIAQALALQANSHGVIFGVDPWRKKAAIEGENRANADWWGSIDIEAIHRQAMQAIWENELDNFAVVIRSESQHAAPVFFKDSIDILNIDANHSEVASCRDALLYLPRVRSGGYIWADDTDWASTQKMVGILDEHCELINNHGHWRLYRKK